MVDVSVLPFGVAFLVSGSLLYIFAVVAVCLRIWSIHIIHRRFRLHDYLVHFALIFATGYIVLSYMCTIMGGLGHHTSELSADTLTNLLSLSIIAETSWMLTTTFIKLSILSLYLDLFENQHVLQGCACGLISFVIVAFIAFVVERFVFCRPITLSSNLSMRGHCDTSIKAGTISATINVILNLAIVVLPIPVAFKLKSSQGNKLKIMSIFAIGVIICLISISHLIVLHILDQADFSYNSLPSNFLACIEIYLSIIAVCLPTLTPIFTRSQNQPLLSPRLTPSKSTWTFNRTEFINSSHTSHPAFDSDEEIYLRDRVSTRYDHTEIRPNSRDRVPAMGCYGNEPTMITTGAKAKKATSIVVDSLF